MVPTGANGKTREGLVVTVGNSPREGRGRVASAAVWGRSLWAEGTSKRAVSEEKNSRIQCDGPAPL